MPYRVLPRIMAAAAGPAIGVGSWSAYSLAIVVVMAMNGLALVVAMMVMALMGRFRPLPKPPAEDEAETRADAGEAEEAAADGGAPAQKQGMRTGTGFVQMAVAAGLSVVSLVAFNLMENMYGRSSAFTACTAVEIALLAAQVVLVVQMIRIQRKRPPGE